MGKYKKHLVLAICLLFVVFSIACQFVSYSGLYINEKTGGWVRLSPDGTYTTVLGIKGDWQANGSQVIFTHGLGTEYGTIQGNTLKTNGGILFGNTVYIRK